LSREVDILAEDEISKSERRAKEHYTKELAEENLKAIRAFSSKFLEILCSIFLATSKDAIGLLRVCVLFLCAILIYIVCTIYVFLRLAFLFNKTSLPDEILSTLFNPLSFRIACFSFLV
jgi:hypothetical protein